MDAPKGHREGELRNTRDMLACRIVKNSIACFTPSVFRLTYCCQQYDLKISSRPPSNRTTHVLCMNAVLSWHVTMERECLFSPYLSELEERILILEEVISRPTPLPKR
ncbi:hypothetical protein CEXT_637001 [Caerostris extrusa]|uniref:Uncharacterized protein n=1 Tax=Caerostris extrusa TaxID=172846 RepID=A0AAV4TCK2_CAEEX|nr:hypothetical protein CEXT_637001 [Caerostris extrusa]